MQCWQSIIPGSDVFKAKSALTTSLSLQSLGFFRLWWWHNRFVMGNIIFLISRGLVGGATSSGAQDYPQFSAKGIVRCWGLSICKVCTQFLIFFSSLRVLSLKFYLRAEEKSMGDGTLALHTANLGFDPQHPIWFPKLTRSDPQV